MPEKVDPPDLGAAQIAARQHGVISIRQLRAVGLNDEAVRARTASGRLHRLHRGVYAVGHRPVSRRGYWMAGVLACGKGAVLSHRSAAELWELLRPERGSVHISTPTHSGRAERAGIRLHRCPSLIPAMTTWRQRIPVTTPGRTIADLRGNVPPRQWRRAVRQAELAGYRLGAEVESDGTRSDLEGEFLEIARRAGLPATPEVNVQVGRWTVDFLWRAERIAVEVDSYRYHRGRIAFQDDHSRDLDLRQLGFDVRRFDERQIEAEPEQVAADLVEAFGRSRARWGQPAKR